MHHRILHIQFYFLSGWKVGDVGVYLLVMVVGVG